MKSATPCGLQQRGRTPNNSVKLLGTSYTDGERDHLMEAE